MSVEIRLSCAMCSAKPEIVENLDFEKHPRLAQVPLIDVVSSIANKKGWIVQYNAPHIDVYCSKRCAQ
jgi:hypothetical protein